MFMRYFSPIALLNLVKSWHELNRTNAWFLSAINLFYPHSHASYFLLREAMTAIFLYPQTIIKTFPIINPSIRPRRIFPIPKT
jgi:hypothetical protein